MSLSVFRVWFAVNLQLTGFPEVGKHVAWTGVCSTRLLVAGIKAWVPVPQDPFVGPAWRRAVSNSCLLLYDKCH